MSETLFKTNKDTGNSLLDDENVKTQDITEDNLQPEVLAWHNNQINGLKTNNKKILEEKRLLDEKSKALEESMGGIRSKLEQYESLISGTGKTIQELTTFYNERKDNNSNTTEEEFLKRGRQAAERELQPEIDRLNNVNSTLEEKISDLDKQVNTYKTVTPIESAVMGLEPSVRQDASTLLKAFWSYSDTYGKLVGRDKNGEMIIDSSGAPKDIQQYVEDKTIYKDYPYFEPKNYNSIMNNSKSGGNLGVNENPWAKGSINLTKQSLLEKTNSSLAAKLKAEARGNKTSLR